jgi:hypothetical protein
VRFRVLLPVTTLPVIYTVNVCVIDNVNYLSQKHRRQHPSGDWTDPLESGHVRCKMKISLYHHKCVCVISCTITSQKFWKLVSGTPTGMDPEGAGKVEIN